LAKGRSKSARLKLSPNTDTMDMEDMVRNNDF
jgi:hypothetical protein